MVKHRLRMNIFGDLFDGDKLKPQNPPERPLHAPLIKENADSYVLQENMFSMSGEDFRVRNTAGDTVINIVGRNINIAGKVVDKLEFQDSAGSKFASVERRILATTTCYDIYNNGGECVAKIDREMFSATPEYKFFYEGDLNPFPDFKAAGSFSERRYTFKNGLGETIARVSRGEEMVRDLDSYQVEVAAGVDAAAIVAVAVVIDEDRDENDG